MSDLDPRFILGSLDLTDYPYGLEFGSDVGGPENIRAFLNSLLVDGELLSVTRTSNREITVPILIEGADLQEVAAAEKALVLEATKARNTLSIDPGDGYAVATVFDTFAADVTFARSDAEEMATLRRYVLTIPALPYGRSEALTTEAAEAIPSVGTVIDDGTSATGWSVVPATTVSPAPAAMVAVVSGRIGVQPYRGKESTLIGSGGEFHSYRYSATRTLSEALTSGAYVSFEVELASPFSFVYSGDLDGGTRIKTVTITSTEFGTESIALTDMIIEAVGAGVNRYTFRVDSAMTLTSITWTATQYYPTSEPDPPYPYLFFDNIAVAASATLGNQVLKTITVGGSARTTGALHIAAPSDSVALGKVLAYTVAQDKVATGWRPDLAQWVLPGATTSTIDGRAGVFSDIDATYGSAGSPVFQAPASMFRSGAYTVAASLWSSGAPSFMVEASLLLGATVVATEELAATTTDLASVWSLATLGTIYLPPTLIQSPSADATIRFRFKGSGAPVILEEMYVFPVEGDLTIIDCGSGTVGPGASSHLWIDSPSDDQPQGGYWRGTTPTREDALSAWSTTTVPGVHSFDPGLMLAFIASLDAQGPSAYFDHHKRWYFHAAE